MAQPVPGDRRRQRLSAAWVFFLVVSAAGPLTSFLGVVPLGFVDGNGAGLPAAYLVATLLLICFAVGYAAISRRVINTGAFYTYIARGIGRPPAIGAALVAVVAYMVNIAGIAGAAATSSRSSPRSSAPTSAGSGAARPRCCCWSGCSATARCGVSAKVLGTLTVLGVVVLVVFDVAGPGRARAWTRCRSRRSPRSTCPVRLAGPGGDVRADLLRRRRDRRPLLARRPTIRSGPCRGPPTSP